MQTIEDMRLWIEAIINSSDDAIISKDLNNIIVSWNKGAENLYGYSEQEVIGKPISIIIPEDKLSDIPMTAELIENRKNLNHMETVRITKEGKRIDVSITVSPIFNAAGELIGSSAIARDIGDRKRSEESLLRSEERYRKIVELSPDTILIHQDGVIIFINQAGLKLLAATDAGQLIGKSVWNLFTPDRHGIIRAHNQTMKMTEQSVANIEHTVIRLDGKIVNVETSSCPLVYEGKQAIYLIMRDISERKKTRTFLEADYLVSQVLANATTLVDGAGEVLKTICNVFKFDIGRLWLVNSRDNVLECISTWASDEDTSSLVEKIKNQVTLKANEGLAGKVWSSETLFWSDSTQPTISNANTDDYDFKLKIGIPIFKDLKVIGIIELLNTEYINKDNELVQIFTSISEQTGVFIEHKLAESKILFLTKHDFTTGLPNRVFFEETLTFEIYRAKSKNKRLAVLLLDIEHFSDINEGMGGEYGDQILKAISQRLIDLVSSSDNVARIGGDQFAVIIDDLRNVEEATEYIGKLKSSIMNDMMIQNQKVSIQLNVGVSFYPEDGDDTQSIIKSGSIALSKAKVIGCGAVQFCTNNMSSRSKNRIGLENNLRHALEKQEFLLYYQPVVDTSIMQVSGFEALIRWSKDGKIVSPIDFIPILEDSQLIVPVSEWVLNTACQQIKIWQDKFQRDMFVSVNISPVQFTHSDIYEVLKIVLKNSSLDPAMLKIEITESAIMHDVQRTIKLLSKIKELGVKISVDDFGTGYSSLNYLRQLPIDYLKIDRSFITNITSNLNDAAIVRTIMGLAENLGFKVIAEGVETEEQMKFINNLGCFEIQGYFFSRPLPINEAEDFLKQTKLL